MGTSSTSNLGDHMHDGRRTCHGRIFSVVNRVEPPTSLVLGLPLLFISFWRAYLALLRNLLVSSAQDWALARDQQEAEEGEE